MILVTGGCGYIGSHVVKLLSESGEQVVVYDDLSQGSRVAVLHGEELVVGSITDVDALRDLFASHDISAVIHLAALVNAAESNEKAMQYKLVNDQGSRNVWQTAIEAEVKHLLYASSAAVYGTPDSRDPILDAPLKPSNTYGVTKLAGEASLRELSGDQVKYVIFRFFNVGGAESEGRLGQSKGSRTIMQRLFAVAAGEDDKATISGHDYDTHDDGTVMRDFVHVEDIALAFVLGLNHLRSGKDSITLNLGSGESHTIGEVIKEVEIATEKEIPIDYGPRIAGDISYSLADISLAEKILGWEPANTLRLIVRDGWNSYVKRSA